MPHYLVHVDYAPWYPQPQPRATPTLQFISIELIELPEHIVVVLKCNAHSWIDHFDAKHAHGVNANLTSLSSKLPIIIE